MARPLIINGAMGSGRHYLVALLEALYAGDPSVRLVDGLPRGADDLVDGRIYHQHLSFRQVHAHAPFERLAEAVDLARVGLVYLHRDPRDMLASILRHHKYHTRQQTAYADAHREFDRDDNDPQSLLRLIEHGRTVRFMDYREFADDIRRFASHPRMCLLRFEELCADPADALHALLAHFGYPADMDAIAAACARVERSGSIGDWQRYFTPEVEAAFKRHAGDLVSWLGYEPDESWSAAARHLPRDTSYSRREYVENCFRLFWQREPMPHEVEHLLMQVQGMPEVRIRDWCMRESGVGIFV
jgi:hypothetical protein